MSKIAALLLKSRLLIVYAYVLLALALLVFWIAFGNALEPQGGYFARLLGTNVVTREVAIALATVGCAGFAWALHMFRSNYEIELAARRKLYKLASDIDFVRKLNTDVMAELHEKSKEDSTIEIIQGDERPPYRRTLDGE